MGVSKNRGTPKWMVDNGKPYSNGWFGGTTIFGNIHMAYEFILNYEAMRRNASETAVIFCAPLANRVKKSNKVSIIPSAVFSPTPKMTPSLFWNSSSVEVPFWSNRVEKTQVTRHVDSAVDWSSLVALVFRRNFKLQNEKTQRELVGGLPSLVG